MSNDGVELQLHVIDNVSKVLAYGHGGRESFGGINDLNVHVCLFSVLKVAVGGVELSRHGHGDVGGGATGADVVQKDRGNIPASCRKGRFDCVLGLLPRRVRPHVQAQGFHAKVDFLLQGGFVEPAVEGTHVPQQPHDMAVEGVNDRFGVLFDEGNLDVRLLAELQSRGGRQNDGDVGGNGAGHFVDVAHGLIIPF